MKKDLVQEGRLASYIKESAMMVVQPSKLFKFKSSETA